MECSQAFKNILYEVGHQLDYFSVGDFREEQQDDLSVIDFGKLQ